MHFSSLSIRTMAEDQVGNIKKGLPDLIGSAHDLPEITEYIHTLTLEWDKIRGPISSWKFWQKTKNGTYKAAKFLIQSIDGLVLLVDDLIDFGPDKKATVLDALNKLYEYVVSEAIPFWMRPFAGKIKNYVIYTVASSTIDWIVTKYKDGSWKKVDNV